ncbi:steroid 17-alpha-hydroxylase/17,20 lyase-like [Pomacea canaliculata]|uniref:steroid 17-alpha-hydroxylase/17,20 lyase-like n=1 Tax=Pomacea canaliculata TaxID=400727 RepID=UPI000D73C8DA|nr:steroid 17-alpha-hydroxylase/17,20 lyase-like [Pomacea canaliculata]
MSEALLTVKEATAKLLDVVREGSQHLPGSPTTQALTVGAVMGALTYLLLKKRYRLPPGPTAFPLVGNLLVFREKDPLYMILLNWSKEKYGPVITLYFGPKRWVTLNSIDVVHEALVKKATDFAGRPYAFWMDLLSEGGQDIAFATYSARWKLLRKVGNQAVRSFMTGTPLEVAVHEIVPLAVDKMAAETGPFDPHVILSSLMFSIIYSMCFGERRGLDDPELLRLMHVLDTGNELIGNGLFEDVVPFLRLSLTPRARQLKAILTELFDLIRINVDKHKETLSKDNIRDMTDAVLLAQKRVEEEENPEKMAMFNDVHVRQIVSDLFVAGVDTTRMTLDWGLYLLASFPEIQRKTQEEIEAVTGDRMPQLADYGKLPYTEAVLYEIMRVGTGVPMGLPHETLCDTTVGGFDVPKGTMVLINHWALHNDPDHWDKPEEFRPERFLDDQGKMAPKPESWLPFSTGRRACLGEAIAKPEIVLVLACILKRLNISLPPGDKFDPRPAFNSTAVYIPKPYRIIVTRRTKP